MLARRARLLVILAVVVAGLPLGALARDRYFCNAMARVMESCCCRHGRTAEPTSCSPRFERQDCCRLLDRTSPEGTAASRGAESRLPAVAAVTLAVLPVPVVLRPAVIVVGEGPVQARAPPRAGPPIFLEHCSLLT